MRNISTLQADKTRMIADATALLERTGLRSAADKEQYRKLIADADLIQSDLDALSHIERNLPTRTPAVADPLSVSMPPSPEQRRTRTNYVWRSWLKSGYDHHIAEHRDLLSSADQTGGALVPEDMQTQFVSQALKFYFPAAQYVRTRWTDNSQPVKVSRVDDRDNGLYLIAEGSGPSEVEPTSFSSSVLTYDQFSTGEVIFSNQLLEDSAFDLANFLSDLASIRFGRGLAAIITNGQDTAGNTTPNNPGLINLASVGSTTSVLADGIGWKDITNLYESLNSAFLPKSVWQMSAATRLYLLQLEDSTSRPYFVPAPTEHDLDLLLGRPVVINDALTGNPTTASSAPILFGDLYNGVQMTIRRLRARVLRERYADQNNSALVTYTGVASTALAPGALQKLVMAAS